MKKPHLFLLFLALLGLGACKKYEDIPSTSNDIWPLTIGNQWTYTDSLFITLDTVRTDTVALVYELTVNAKGYHGADDPEIRREMYWVEYELQETGGKINLLVWPDETGIGWKSRSSFLRNVEGVQTWAPGRLPDADIEPYALLYPASPGQLGRAQALAWVDGFSPGPGVTVVAPDNPFAQFGTLAHYQTAPMLELAAKPDTLNTAAGTFECLNYGDQWWSPGTGLIAAELSNVSDWLLYDWHAYYYPNDPNPYLPNEPYPVEVRRKRTLIEVDLL